MENRSGKGTPYTLNRYFKRLFLPAAFVALVAVIGRFWLTYEFNEEHVSVDSDYAQSERGTQATDKADRDTRTETITRLERSLSALRERAESLPSQSDVDSASDLGIQAEESIQKLTTVVEDSGWSEQLDTARQALESYARAIGERQ